MRCVTCLRFAYPKKSCSVQQLARFFQIPVLIERIRSISPFNLLVIGGACIELKAQQFLFVGNDYAFAFVCRKSGLLDS